MAETDNALREFGKGTLALCEVLHRDTPLDDRELLSIDNHIQVLQIAYFQWKKRQKKDTTW
jgi:hypothetical protein